MPCRVEADNSVGRSHSGSALSFISHDLATYVAQHEVELDLDPDFHRPYLPPPTFSFETNAKYSGSAGSHPTMENGDASAPPSINSTVSGVIDRPWSQHAACDVGDAQKASSDCAQETTFQLCMEDSNTPQSYASSIYSDHTSSGYMTASSSSSPQAPLLECSKCKDVFKRPCDLK